VGQKAPHQWQIATPKNLLSCLSRDEYARDGSKQNLDYESMLVEVVDSIDVEARASSTRPSEVPSVAFLAHEADSRIIRLRDLSVMILGVMMYIT
jgi:hypothetical protein